MVKANDWSDSGVEGQKLSKSLEKERKQGHYYNLPWAEESYLFQGYNRGGDKCAAGRYELIDSNLSLRGAQAYQPQCGGRLLVRPLHFAFAEKVLCYCASSKRVHSMSWCMACEI